MGTGPDAQRLLRAVVGLPLLAVVAVAWFSAAAYAADAANAADSLSDADKACIGCHAAQGATKQAANGDTLSLTVDADAFAKSVHKPVGCGSCHGDLKADHFSNPRPIKSAHEYAVKQAQNCRACHDKMFAPYEGSLHGVKLREGNPVAPKCTSCHQPHAVMPASVQEGPKNVCITCHAGVEDQHAKWLQNAGRHLEAVACSACHAPNALRKVDLRLYRPGAAASLVDADGKLAFEKRAVAADANRDGLDAKEFQALLTSIQQDQGKLAVRGFIELRNGIDAHQLSPKSEALKDCVACHQEGSPAFQRVTVSVQDASGRRVRYDAHREILTSAVLIDELRSFYAIGGTRIGLLDVALALGLIGGISVPVLHMMLKRFVQRGSNKEGERQ